MSPIILFPHLQDFRLIQMSCNEEAITLECERTTPTAPCPMCQATTRHIHSSYRRVICDLPINGKTVLLLLHVRKFYCKDPACPRRVFAERLPQLTSSHGQNTIGLRVFLATLGREAGGAGGGRVGDPSPRRDPVGTALPEGETTYCSFPGPIQLTAARWLESREEVVQCPTCGSVSKAKLKGQSVVTAPHPPRKSRPVRNVTRWMEQGTEWALVQKIVAASFMTTV